MKSEKKKFTVPHVYILLLGLILICCVLTYIVPAGQYDMMTVGTREVVDGTTFHTVEQSPVSLMGFLMLIGIVVNNGILFVDSANMLRQEMPVDDALIETGVIRLRPILMTTLTTILSMVPMGMGLGGGNARMTQGMALVIIGGLIASTLLTLILIPTFYLILDKKERVNRRAKKLKARKNE